MPECKEHKEKKTKPKKTCNEAAIALVGRRDYSQSELTQKLTLKGYTQEEIAHTLGRLKTLGYVDDAKYAKHFVADKARLAGWGTLRIEMALRQKRITEAHIAQAFSVYEEKITAEQAPSWLEVATTLLERRYGTFIGMLDGADFQKRINFLLRRGYSFDEAKAALAATRGEE